MNDALAVSVVTLRSRHPLLRALLWVVIVVVPGGMLLLALLCADSWQRRQRTPVTRGLASLPRTRTAGGSETA